MIKRMYNRSGIQKKLNNENTSLMMYFNSIDSGKLLTKKEEMVLAKTMDKARYRTRKGKLSTKKLWKDGISFDTLKKAQWARNKLISSNFRLVISVAKGFQNKGCDLEDIIQEGNIGLMDGIDRFEWNRGLKISTYVTWWIRQRIDRFISNQGRTVRVPVHVQSLASKLKKIIDCYENEFGQKPSLEEISSLLDCSEDMAKEAMNVPNHNISTTIGLSPTDKSDNEDECKSFVPDEEGIDPTVFVSHLEIIDVIRDVASELSERDEKILRLRFGIKEDPHNHNHWPITQKELKELKARK